jgi:thioredoxin 1
MEQEPINREVGKSLGVAIEEIDAVRQNEFIARYNLKVTPTIVILADGVEKERFEGVVHAEQLEGSVKKFL